MNCQQCLKKWEYNSGCHACGVRLILSGFPNGYLARAQTDFVRNYFKTDIEPIIEEARKTWKSLKSL